MRPARSALLLGVALMANAQAAEPIRYLALGDSYTVGESVPEPARWPVQLADALRADGIEIAAPRVIATTGWSTDELSAAMDAAEPLGEWDFVSLLIGVNDQYRGREVADFRPAFRALLARAVTLAQGRRDRVLVLAIPDWGVTRFGHASGREVARIAVELDAYNAAVRDEAQRQHVAFVDIAPVSRARGGETAMQADDGLHPSAALYALWSALAAPIARALLRDPH
jgi:lysophospholipase L1-like esterase